MCSIGGQPFAVVVFVMMQVILVRPRCLREFCKGRAIRGDGRVLLRRQGSVLSGGGSATFICKGRMVRGGATSGVGVGVGAGADTGGDDGRIGKSTNENTKKQNDQRVDHLSPLLRRLCLAFQSPCCGLCHLNDRSTTCCSIMLRTKAHDVGSLVLSFSSTCCTGVVLQYSSTVVCNNYYSSTVHYVLVVIV